jgi:hypothetical protein
MHSRKICHGTLQWPVATCQLTKHLHLSLIYVLLETYLEKSRRFVAGNNKHVSTWNISILTWYAK